MYLVGLGLFVVLVFYILDKWARQRFEERFPPISDAEFVARSRPGTNPKVALKVRRIVADNLGVEYDRIYPSTRFTDDLGV
jgi:hypothetical protein